MTKVQDGLRLTPGANELHTLVICSIADDGWLEGRVMPAAAAG